jgi:hypothetical protein
LVGSLLALLELPELPVVHDLELVRVIHYHAHQAPCLGAVAVGNATAKVAGGMDVLNIASRRMAAWTQAEVGPMGNIVAWAVAGVSVPLVNNAAVEVATFVGNLA